MKRRDNKGLVGAPSADLLVCFPSRAHLTLMPKPICSPARPSDSNKRPLHHHHHLKRITTRARAGGGGGGGGPPSPLLWANKKQIQGRGEGGDRGSEVSEPSSPKVTCAGQIKVRPRASGAACRNWQSVMEEIERIHNRSKLQRQKKANSNWLQPLGFKKDVLNFLTCLRNVRFDFRCFGSFPEPDITSDDDDQDDEDEEAEDDDDDQHCLEAAEDQKSDDQGNNNNNNNSAVFSKWFMVLQDNSELQSNSKIDGQVDSDNAAAAAAPAVPPPNALLLMRCRSAPAKSWLDDKENRDRVIANAKKRETENGKDQDQDEDEGKEDEEKEKQLLSLSVVEEEDKHCKKKRRESLAILMKYDTDFYNMSSDVAQETWLVGGVRGGAGAGGGARGGLKDPFSRSRSWRR